MVLGEDIGFESFQPCCFAYDRQMSHQDGADSQTLIGVVHGKCDLGFFRLVIQDDISADGHRLFCAVFLSGADCEGDMLFEIDMA